MRQALAYGKTGRQIQPFRAGKKSVFRAAYSGLIL
jgi:hypothetical protein